MANLCDLVLISLKQAATFGLEVVIHSEADAFQPEPPEIGAVALRDFCNTTIFFPLPLL